MAVGLVLRSMSIVLNVVELKNWHAGMPEIPEEVAEQVPGAILGLWRKIQ